jgi:hypothetical protein
LGHQKKVLKTGEADKASDTKATNAVKKDVKDSPQESCNTLVQEAVDYLVWRAFRYTQGATEHTAKPLRRHDGSVAKTWKDKMDCIQNVGYP